MLDWLYSLLSLMTLIWVIVWAKSYYNHFMQPYSHKDTRFHSWKSCCTLGDSVGVASIQGRRPHMEDTYVAVQLGDDSRKAAFYGVFDGHGGSRASAYTAETLHRLLEQSTYHVQPETAIRECFRTLDNDWLELAESNQWDDGTTAITALIVDNVLYVGNVGDSRAVLSTRGQAEQLSSDHKPNRKDEKERIEKAGGKVVFYGTWRVEGMLAVSRAIGDRRLKKYVTADPEIHKHVLTKDDEYLILASDGLWDVLDNQYAVEIVQRATSPSEAAKALTEHALQLGTMDNTTSLVVDLRKWHSHPATSASIITTSASDVHTPSRSKIYD